MASIVVDNDVTFSAGLPAQATPLDAFADLPGVINRFSAKFDTLGEGTVILGSDPVRRLKFPEHAPTDLDAATAHPLLTPARERGWSVQRLQPWMTFHRKGCATVHIGIRPWLDDETFEIGDPDPANTAYRMEWITRQMRGTAYRARPGVVGTAAVRRFLPGQPAIWQPQNWKHCRPVVENMAWEQRYIWANPDASLDDQKWLHGWDVRQQFLAAASLAELSRTPLHHTGVREFSRDLTGYWRIMVPVWNLSHVLPHPAGQFEAGDLAWVTSPTMALLEELAETGVIARPEILDSWTATHGTRLLRPWAENIRNAIAAAKMERDPEDARILTAAMKHCYTHAIDMWGTPTSSIIRHDWRHTIHGRARCLFWRKLWAQYKADGRVPVKIYHDMAYYASTHMDPEVDRPSTFTPSPFMGKLRYGKSEEL